MTDQELNVAMAEKVMGWAREGAWWYANKKLEGRPIEHYHDWSPSTDIAAAFKVGEKVGGCWGVQYGPARKEWTANFCTMMGAPTFRASAKTVSRAICLAILEAVGVEAP